MEIYKSFIKKNLFFFINLNKNKKKSFQFKHD